MVKNRICATISNSIFIETGKTATGVLFGTQIRKPLDLLAYRLPKVAPEAEITRTMFEPIANHYEVGAFPIEP